MSGFRKLLANTKISLTTFFKHKNTYKNIHTRDNKNSFHPIEDILSNMLEDFNTIGNR